MWLCVYFLLLWCTYLEQIESSCLVCLYLTSSLFLLDTGTPLHNAAKERKKKAIRFLVENGAFLPDDINDSRFNPPVHYCPGLEWAYEEMRRLQLDSSSSGETSCSSDNWGVLSVMLLLLLALKKEVDSLLLACIDQFSWAWVILLCVVLVTSLCCILNVCSASVFSVSLSNFSVHVCLVNILSVDIMACERNSVWKTSVLRSVLWRLKW